MPVVPFAPPKPPALPEIDPIYLAMAAAEMKQKKQADAPSK